MAVRQLSRSVRWRKRARAAFTERLPLKATAVFLGLVLWVITSTREESEELLPVRFAPVLDGTLELAGEPPQVRALVRGLGREMLKLHQTPPVIRRTIAGDLPDTITMDLRAVDVDLPPGIDARVLDVRPRTITLVFKSTVSRRVPVRSGLLVAPDSLGRVAAGLFFQPESVVVTGRRRGVARVQALRTVAETLPPTEGRVHQVALDTTGLGSLGVRIRPAFVRVRVSRLARAEEAFGESEPNAPTVVRRPPPPLRRTLPPDTTPRDTARHDSTRHDATRRDTTRALAPRDSTTRPSAERDSMAPHVGGHR